MARDVITFTLSVKGMGLTEEECNHILESTSVFAIAELNSLMRNKRDSGNNYKKENMNQCRGCGKFHNWGVDQCDNCGVNL